MRNVLRLVLASTLIAPLAARAVEAGSGNMTVTATVAKKCTVSATPLAFPEYDPTSAAPVLATASISVLCTKASETYWIGLEDGANAAAAGGQRRMANGAQYLNYDLFSDAGRTVAWRNVSHAGGVITSTSAATANVKTVYGRIPAGQDVNALTYTDTVRISVNY